MIAKKRGLDPEITSIVAMLHDYYAYKMRTYDDHALKSADGIHHCMNDLSKSVNENEQARFEKLCVKFDM